MLPDFNRLRVFFHIYADHGVGAAAKKLHVTQSAVSQSLRKLEDELGTQLFVRNRSGLVATQAAHSLFGVVSPFIESLRFGVEGLRRARTELTGLIRIGAPVELGTQRLPAILGAFRAQHQGVRFELRLGHPWALIPLLERGELDMALADVFASRERQHVGLAVQKLVDEELVLVGTKKYVRTMADAKTFAGLTGASFVAYRSGAPALHSWFAHHYNKSALTLDIALTVESVQAVLGAIEHHMGLGVVPSHLVQQQLSRRRLVKIGTKRKALTNRISLVRLLDRVPSVLERALATFLRLHCVPPAA